MLIFKKHKVEVMFKNQTKPKTYLRKSVREVIGELVKLHMQSAHVCKND